MAVAVKKEAKQTMRFPLTSFGKNGEDCAHPELRDWFWELKRSVCYPIDFEGRKVGLGGPSRKTHEI
jgi:hypothetical protein